MSAIVFLGPTLPRAEARALLAATYLPPARQGDIYRAVRLHRPIAVGLIDGRFLDSGAVWHREILWALSEGIHVFGAASMGALRAAELAPFGMRGVGQIFTAYRDGCWPGDANAFEDDDEVAVIHAPPEVGGAALSDAMVDLRATLAAAEAAGVIALSDLRALTAALKRRHFAERSYAAMLDDAVRLLDAATVRSLAEWLLDNKVARKRLDAIEMLQAMATLVADEPPRITADFVMQEPMFWRRFVAECASEEADTLDPPARRVIERLRRDPEGWHACARAAFGRLPQNFGRPAAAAEVPPHRALAKLRRERGLWQRNDLLAWMAANALDEAGLEQLLLREDQLDRVVATEALAGLRRAMIDHLRLSGRFAAILRDVGGESS